MGTIIPQIYTYSDFNEILNVKFGNISKSTSFRYLFSTHIFIKLALNYL